MPGERTNTDAAYCATMGVGGDDSSSKALIADGMTVRILYGQCLSDYGFFGMVQ